MTIVESIGYLFVRAASAFFGVQFGVLFVTYGSRLIASPSPGIDLIDLALVGLLFTVAVVGWFAAAALARGLVRGVPNQEPSPITPHQLAALGSFLIGVALLVNRGPYLAFHLIGHVRMSVDDKSPAMLANLAAETMVLGAGLFLVLGSGGVARIFTWTRRAGLHDDDPA